jgi:Leucine-rich repeat (LRR) protein
MSSLQSLHLGNNLLASIPQSLGRLNALCHLSLQSNRISALPASILSLVRLQTLATEVDNTLMPDMLE